MTDTINALEQEVKARAAQRPDATYLLRNSKLWEFPAERFEQKTGLAGISKEYVLPEGKDYVDIAAELMQSEAVMRELQDYAQVIAAMPQVDDAALKEIHTRLKTEKKAFRAEMQGLIEDGSLEEVEEAMAMRGYAIEDKEKAVKTLNNVVAVVGSFSLEEFGAVYTKCAEEDKALLKSTYAELEALNPELAALTPDISNRGQMWDVLMGVLSKFNIPDVKCFAIDRITGVEADADPQFAARERSIKAQAGVSTDWVPAPSTQHRILQQLQQRAQLDAAMSR